MTSEWSIRATKGDVFSFTEIESLAGLFQWISIVCPAIIPSIASLQSIKHSMKRSGAVSRHLDDRSKMAIVDLALFLLRLTHPLTLVWVAFACRRSTVSFMNGFLTSALRP